MAEINVKLGGDSSEFKGMIDDSTAYVGKFSRSIKDLLPVASAAAVVAFFRSVVDEAGKLQDLSDRLSVSTDALQAFDRTVRLAGGSSEQAAMIWDKSRKAIDELVSGSKPMIEAFDKIGLSAKDFIGLNYEQALDKIAKGYADNKDKAGAYAATVEILGAKSFPKLMAAILEVAEKGLPKMKDELDGAMSKPAISFLDNLGDSFSKIGNAAKAAAANGLHFFATTLGKIGAMPGEIAAELLHLFSGGKFMDTMGEQLKKTDAELDTIKGTVEEVKDETIDWGIASASAIETATTGEEKLNALYEEQRELMMQISNGLMDQTERRKLLLALKKINIEIIKQEKTEEAKAWADDKKWGEEKMKELDKLNQKKVSAHVAEMNAKDKLIAKAIEQSKAEGKVLSEFEKQLDAINKMAGQGKGGFKAGPGGGKEGTVTIAELENAVANAKKAFDLLQQNPNDPAYSKNYINTQALIDQLEKNLKAGKMAQGINGDGTVNISNLTYNGVTDAADMAFGGTKESLSLQEKLLKVAIDTDTKITEIQKSAEVLAKEFKE